MRYVVVYNLNNVEFIIIKTSLPHATIIKKAKEFRDKDRGGSEWEFAESLAKEFPNEHIEQIDGDAVDFDNLDCYDEE